MTTWRYTVVPMLLGSDETNANPTKYIDLMNELGAIGYELVAVYNDCLIFKQPCTSET